MRVLIATRAAAVLLLAGCMAQTPQSSDFLARHAGTWERPPGPPDAPRIAHWGLQTVTFQPDRTVVAFAANTTVLLLDGKAVADRMVLSGLFSNDRARVQHQLDCPLQATAGRMTCIYRTDPVGSPAQTSTIELVRRQS
jgi:hypothetical protein